MGKNAGVFIGLNLVLLLFFVKFIPRVFELHGKAFVGELLLLGLFLAVALIAMLGAYFDLDFAFPTLLIFFAVSLVNTLFLYFNYGFRLYNVVILSFVGLLGFVISLNKLDKPTSRLPADLEIPEPVYSELDKATSEKELKSFVEELPESKTIFEDIEFEKADKKEVAELKRYSDENEAIAKTSAEKKYSTMYSPGKFVASKTGASYHAPKCEWAEKIKKNNRVWLADK